jgi:nucleoside-diphosphate-sugar epimerase
MRFQTALVTGATGFIGRALCRRLLRAGIRVGALTRRVADAPDGTDAIALAGLDESSLGEALAGRRFDVVFHLAAYGVAPSDRDPAAMLRINVAGTDAVLRAAALCEAGAVVYAGSCSEYRTPPQGTFVDEDAPLTTAALYGASKAAGGLWGQAAAGQLGLGFQWLRLFNVFGPGESAHRLIPSIVTSLLRDEPVRLSPGEQVRDFLFIDDVAEAIHLAAEAALAGKLGPFNVCSGSPITVRDLTLAVAEAMNKPATLLDFGALSYRPDECLWLVGQPDRFELATGFRPSVPLVAGIEAMIAEGRSGAHGPAT